MTRTMTTVAALAALTLAAAGAQAQAPVSNAGANARKSERTDTSATERKDTSTVSPSASMVNVFRKTVTAVRPYDQRGINTFEMPKPAPDAVFTGPSLDIGAAFAQSFQSLDHSNTAAPRMV